MKMMETGAALLAGMAAGAVVGACLVMNNPGARRIYRCGKRYAQKLMQL
ncbi:MAG: hypothetical protein J6X30_01915 [Clostridia bacterium]|nr:hypothetical protein [Clostridia bacterium]